MRDPIVVFRQLGINIRRYALNSNPWSEFKEGRFELTCMECRDRGLPLVVGEWDKTSVFSMILFMNRHEKEAHPNVAVTKAVA